MGSSLSTTQPKVVDTGQTGEIKVGEVKTVEGEVKGGGKRRKTKGGKNNKKKRKSKRRLGGAIVF